MHVTVTTLVAVTFSLRSRFQVLSILNPTVQNRIFTRNCSNQKLRMNVANPYDVRTSAGISVYNKESRKLSHN